MANFELAQKAFSDVVTLTRNTSATYWDRHGVLQTALADVPRFDHDPGTLDASTQSINLSTLTVEDISAGVDGTPLTVSLSGSVVYPLGTVFVLSDSADIGRYISGTVTASSAGSVTFTVQKKVGTGVGSDWAAIRSLGLLVESVPATNLLLNSFSPATQSVAVSDATTYTLSVYGSGSAEITAGGSGTATDGSPLTFTTTGTSVTVTVTGALDAFQLETGPVATSPIETTGSAVTRAADVASAENSFLDNFDSSQGWLFIEYDLASDGFALQIETEGATNSYNSFYIESSSITLFDSDSVAFRSQSDYTGRHKVLLSWRAGVVSAYADGALLFSGEYVVPQWVRALFFRRTNGATPGNGHLFELQMGDTISDADAIARTTL